MYLVLDQGRTAFVETDQDGRRNIESFAAQHQSIINFMPVEGRVCPKCGALGRQIDERSN